MYFLLLSVPVILFLIWRNKKSTPDPRFKDVKAPGTSPDVLDRPEQPKDKSVK